MTDYLFSKVSLRLTSIVLIISFLVGYSIESSKKRQQLATDAKKVANVVSNAVDYVSALSIYLGETIARDEKYDDYEFIYNLFKETAYNQDSIGETLSWAMFNWGDEKHRLVVRTVDGVQLTPINLIDRSYTWRSKYERWKLQFAKPDYGRVSKTWVLPAALGISNPSDQFMGSIITGINLRTLLRKTESVVNSGNAFIIANRDAFNQDQDKIILASSNTPKISQDYKKLPEIVDNFRDWMNSSGTMESKINSGRYSFTYYYLIQDHPLVVMTGYNRLSFWSSIISSTAKIFIVLFVICMLTREKRKKDKTKKMLKIARKARKL